MTLRHSLDPSYRRPAGRSIVIGGSPLRLFRLGPAGVRVVEALERCIPLPAGHEPLTDRLVDAGAVHPLPELGASDVDPSTVTLVIPSAGEVPRCLSGPWRCRVIVVDDGADPPMAPRAGVEIVRLERNAGPGAARNAGLAQVATPFVAFVDADADADEATVLALLAHHADPRVALAAPRIVADGDAGVLGRFERRHSPLDMGATPARIAPTTRVSYVPAAALVCRTDAVRAVGGFDAALRYGEDVDLVWRLVEAGWRCRYEPRCTVRHRTRRTLGAFVAQRFRYGTSAAPLAARHPGVLAPLRMSPWSAATWLPVVLGHPVVGATIGLGTASALIRKLPDLPAAESFRLAAVGNSYAGRLIASTLTRAWWPVALAMAVVSRRARWVLAAAAIAPAVVEWRAERPELDPARYVGLRLLDDASYGAGVWAGAVRERSAAALLPAFEAWPPKAGRSV